MLKSSWGKVATHKRQLVIEKLYIVVPLKSCRPCAANCEKFRVSCWEEVSNSLNSLNHKCFPLVVAEKAVDSAALGANADALIVALCFLFQLRMRGNPNIAVSFMGYVWRTILVSPSQLLQSVGQCILHT